jgi:hypothetical protein
MGSNPARVEGGSLLTKEKNKGALAAWSSDIFYACVVMGREIESPPGCRKVAFRKERKKK